MDGAILTERLDAYEEGAVERAAGALRAGRLVAFPTETVYGLGADALDEAAVLRIFEAKGRPADNPLIVHVCDHSMRSEVTESWPDVAEKLAAAFWPGPLTLVVPRGRAVPAAVSGGLGTVAVRCPDHDVALALIRAAGRPLAAPSANRSGRPSATTAEAVMEEFREANPGPAYVLDAGPVAIGVESTVVDVTGGHPLVLRPGGLALEDLRSVCPDVALAEDAARLARSPGTRYRHYAPRVPLWLFRGPGASRELLEEARRARAAGARVAILAPHETAKRALAAGLAAGEAVADAGPRSRPGRYAAVLFDALRRLEAARGVERILAEAPGATGLGRAVGDRLARAATRVVDAPPARVLFVCSGNTCRSPMAAALAERIAGQMGERLAARSAGLAAADGQPAADEARAAVREWGIDLSGHRSHQVKVEDVDWAELVVAMEEWQARALAAAHPDAAHKIVAWSEEMGGGDVADPFGRGAAAYKVTVDRLASDLRRWFQRMRGGAR